MNFLDRLEVAALTAFAEANVRPDIQGLLVNGNPKFDVAPGALRKALLAALRAMEDPTEEMVAKGVNRAAGFASAGNRMCNGYRAMISAAIQQAETEG